LEDCVQFDTIDLIIHPAFEIQNLVTVEYCDTDFDGTTSIALSTFNAYVSEGINSPNVRYYLTETDAVDDTNALPTSFVNTSNPITIYTRVTNTLTDCFDIAPLEIVVIDPPVVYQPSDIIICDDDQDGYYFINLNNSISEIVTDTTDLLITFHTSDEDANSGTDAIPTPGNYNANTQTVFVRVESLITTCHSVVELNIIVNTLPQFETISVFEVCESDGDGFSDFFFSLKDEEILNDQTGKEVLYFENQQDAIDRINIIDKNAAYQNLTNPQTIYVRVENITDITCFGVSSFEIVVTQFVTYNPPQDIIICDDSSNDGIALLDLSQKIQEISNGININLDISFHTSYQDADLDVNELPLNYTNQFNPQTIYARIDNDILCAAIAEFVINIIQVPEINPAPDLINCDDDYDGLTTFDLTQVETEVLDVRADDIRVSYYETFENAQNNTDILVNPDLYNNTSNPQIVYIRVTNTLSNCFSIEPINLSVILPPLINNFETYNTCVNASNSFDLNEIDSVIIDDNTDVILSYFESNADAQNNSNALNLNYTYTTTNDIIFSRVQHAETGCFYIYPFELVVNPLPIANQPPDLEACDDNSNDAIEDFNLFSVNNAVLGTQNPNDFTVTYFNSEAEADLGTNPVTYNYTGIDGELIFARIENNTTGCYSLTQFNLIVNPHPNIPSLITNCDTDYDGSTSFDLTQAETELFNTANPDHVFSYFETLEDLQNDVDAISDPTSYNNQLNPQTVYIKVFNTVANCYTFVPLELEVNLPPAIDALEIFELCENTNGMVTLSDINSTLLIQTANVLVTYYASETDALNQINALDDDYAYQSTNDTVYARIEFSTTHCYYIHEFNLVINPLPVANPPDDLVECDNDNDGVFIFDLTLQDAMVLNGQNPDEFTVSYYTDLPSAEDNTNPINTIYEATNGETIYVRVESNLSGCYDITSFNIFIHPKPVVNIGSQVICLENLPLFVSANTNQPGDSYLWSTNQTTPEIEITEVGTYSVVVTTPFGCETTEVFTVSESQAATTVITETINFSDPNNIVITVNGIGDYVYQLDDGDPQISNVFQNVSLGYHTLKIIDLNGCDTIIKEVVVIDAPKFMTPNDDGKFDTWHITGVETLPGTVIYIFDRYGKLLKTLTSNSPGWNGYYNGNLMPNSDYWFLAKVKDGSNTFEVKGHFSLRY
ncbi:MAG: T9SS type B sorting domain-containing protein, partial [Algicola sp.]|nr:T9SS type B sorting domain-containing protein [Algicola sp.]